MKNKPVNVGFLITARLKSTRLPKKLLLKIKDKPVLSHMIDRLKQSKKINEIVICTSEALDDKPLTTLALENGVQFYCGDPDDVLGRLLGAAEKFKFDYILNITADCPFVDPFYADSIIDSFVKTDADLIRQFDLPHGAFSYGIKIDALKKVIQLKDSENTEVWGRYFTDTGLFHVLDLPVINTFHKRPWLRMTLDYPEDFEFFQAVFNALYIEGTVFTLDQILSFLDENPEVMEINKSCSERFQKRFFSQSEPKLKKVIRVNKALVIGSGSIGQKHIKNLKRLGIDSIFALRTRKGHFQNLPSELGVIEIKSWEEAIHVQPDIAIISNPTSHHLEAAFNVAPFVKGMLIEKPISHSLEGTEELSKVLIGNRIVAFIGHNLMFHPIIQAIKQFSDKNDVGRILNIQCQVGQWLPNWHPYEDYTKAYYARKELGGGAVLTLIHEIHLAIELAGLPTQVFGVVSDFQKFGLDVEARADLMIKHDKGAVSQIHLDFLQRPSHRSGLITFERGWLSYDFNEKKLVGQTETQSPFVIWSDPNYDYNLMYLNMLEQFIQYVEEKRVRHRFDITLGIESLKVVEALFEANEKRCSIDVSSNSKGIF